MPPLQELTKVNVPFYSYLNLQSSKLMPQALDLGFASYNKGNWLCAPARLYKHMNEETLLKNDKPWL